MELFAANDSLWSYLGLTELVFMTMTCKTLRGLLLQSWPVWAPLLKNAGRKVSTQDVVYFLQILKGHTHSHRLLHSRCQACLRPRAPSALTTKQTVIHLCVHCSGTSKYFKLVTNKDIARARHLGGFALRTGEWRLKTSLIQKQLYLARRRQGAGSEHLYWAFPLERLGLKFS